VCVSMYLMYLCYIAPQVGVPMPESDTVPVSGRPDPNSVDLLQHINAMLDNPLDISEGLPRGSPGDGESEKTSSCVVMFRVANSVISIFIPRYVSLPTECN